MPWPRVCPKEARMGFLAALRAGEEIREMPFDAPGVQIFLENQGSGQDRTLPSTSA
jgi:hypothetical protein